MAWCKNCGRQLSDRDTVCGTCFTPVVADGVTNVAPNYNVFCIIGFTASLMFFLSFLIPPLIFLSILSPGIGLAFSIAGTATCRNPYKKGQIFGILGIVFAGLEIFLSVIVFFWALFTIKVGPHRIDMKYMGKTEQIGPFEIMYENEGASKGDATVLRWRWSGDPGDNVIEIPENAGKNTNINSAGNWESGETPTSGEVFLIVFDDPDRNFKLSSEFKDANNNMSFIADPYLYGVPEGTEVKTEEITFTIRIGKNIEFFTGYKVDTFFLVRNEDGSITYYKTNVVYEVSPDNPSYYSSDGKLLEKKPDASS